ncbi:MAG: helix-turn-helix transcriptional regulator [Acidaminococcaceae bacterium]|nr:helix-turn-helix transcriptional regulator [Acidaminococcaceae bacterium]
MAKKPLWDFIEKRMHELGLTRYDLEMDYDIPYATMQRAKAGSTNFKEATKQKFALALQCSVGDINAAISGSVPELPKIEPEEPDAVIGSINLSGITEATGKAGALEAPKNEPAKKGTAKKERQKERWPEDPPEEKKTPPPDYVDAAIYSATEPPDVFGIKRARREAVAEYKQKLKDICIAAYLDVPKLNITGETATGYIGRALMKELLKDDTEAE